MTSTDQLDINRTSEHNKKTGMHVEDRHYVRIPGRRGPDALGGPRASIRDAPVGGVNADHSVHGKERKRGGEWVGSIPLV